MAKSKYLPGVVECVEQASVKPWVLGGRAAVVGRHQVVI